MRRRAAARRTQHPLGIAGHRQAARLVGQVAQRQARQPDRRVERDMDEQVALDLVRHGMIARIAKAVPGDARAAAQMS